MGVLSAAIYDCLVVVVVVGRWSSCFYSASRRSSSTSSTHPRQFTVFITSLITCRARRTEANCIVVTAVCVSVCPSPHSHTILHGPGCN